MINMNTRIFGRRSIVTNNSASLDDIYVGEATFESTNYDMLETIVSIEQMHLSIQQTLAYAMECGVDNPDILMEGIKDMGESAVEFFKKIIKKFTTFMRNMFLRISSYIGDFSKFITKHKDELDKVKCDFTYDGYEFHFPKIPIIAQIDKTIDDYNSRLDRFDDFTEADLNKEKIMYNKSRQDDALRAIVIGESGNIPAEEFSEKVKKKFRKKSKLVVNTSVYKDCLDNYDLYKKELDDAKKMSEEIKRTLYDMEKVFEKSVRITGDGTTEEAHGKHMDKKQDGGISTTNVKVDTTKAVLLSKYNSFKLAQTKKMCNMMILVSTARVNALKDKLTQDRAIIRKAMTSKTEQEV